MSRYKRNDNVENDERGQKRLSLVMNKSLDEGDQQRLIGDEDLIEMVVEEEEEDDEECYDDNDSLETSRDVSSFDYTSASHRRRSYANAYRNRQRRQTDAPNSATTTTTTTTSGSYPYPHMSVATNNRILNKRFVQLLTEIYEIAQVFPYVLSKFIIFV